jgi:hypothetical protein
MGGDDDGERGDQAFRVIGRAVPWPVQLGADGAGEGQCEAVGLGRRGHLLVLLAPLCVFVRRGDILSIFDENLLENFH